MDRTDRTSVIIVSWNTRELLLQCLRSLNTEGNDPDEIIVVDNASCDGSAEAVEAAFPRVRVVRNRQNLGFSGANNIGIRQSTGDFLCLINSDVVVREGCLEKMRRHMQDHPEIGVLGPKVLWPDGLTVQRSCMGYPTLWNMLCRTVGLDSFFPKMRLFGGFLMTYWPHDSRREVDVINGCFWMIRRSAVEEVGLLDEDFFMYAEDIDWCKRFHDKGWKLVFYPEAEAIHYGGASSAAMPVRFYVEKQRANFQYWRKHHGRISTEIFYLMILVHESIRVLAYSLLSWKRKGPLLLQPGHKAHRSVECIRALIRLSRSRAAAAGRDAGTI